MYADAVYEIVPVPAVLPKVMLTSSKCALRCWLALKLLRVIAVLRWDDINVIVVVFDVCLLLLPVFLLFIVYGCSRICCLIKN